MAELSKILDALYEGTLNDVAWDQSLVAIADLVRGSAAYLFAFNPQNGQVLRDENHRGDPKVLEDYRAYWTYQDPRLPAFLRAEVGCPATEGTMLDIRKWRRSAVFNEFLVPVDSPHFMPVWLNKSASKAVTLSIQGTRRRGPFELADVSALKELAPHLRRALMIRDRLESLRIRADALAQTLDRARFGVIILDSAGRLVETNYVADKLLSSRDSGVRRKADGTLEVLGLAGIQLSRLLAAGRSSPLRGLPLMELKRPSGRPLSALVAKLPVARTSWVGADPTWMLLLFDPDRRLEVSADLIQTDLGLSMREAHVAALLASGANLREISQHLRISIHTARHHLKAILRKTDLRSQSDLIRRIASGPAALATPSDSAAPQY